MHATKIPASGLAIASILLLATSAAGQQQDEDCDGPGGLTATVLDEGIRLDWQQWSFARAYEVYRSEGGGAFMLVGSTSGDNPGDGMMDPHVTTFLDTDVEAGVSYTYYVQALGPPPHLSDICGQVEATAVPVLPGPAALVAVAAVSVTAAAGIAWRRR